MSALVRGEEMLPRAGAGCIAELPGAGALRDTPLPATAGDAPPFCSSILIASSGVGMSAT
jgi:hypothetical protein